MNNNNSKARLTKSFEVKHSNKILACSLGNVAPDIFAISCDNKEVYIYRTGKTDPILVTVIYIYYK